MHASSDRPGKPAADFPVRGRLLGVDYGTRRLGFAISTADQTISSPVANHTRQGHEGDARFVRKLIAEYGPVGLIVGLPVHMSGDEGGKARETREFGSWLARIAALPVRYADERYSSLIAEQLLGSELSPKKRQARLDMLAAQYILQGYLDRQNKTAAPGPI